MERKNISLSITFHYPKIFDRIARIDLQELRRNLFEMFENFSTNLSESVSQKQNEFKQTFNSRMPSSPRFRFRKKTLIRLLVPVVAILVIIFVARVVTTTSPSTTVSQSVRGENINIQEPLASRTLNKKYVFPLKNELGKEVASFTYIVENAEIREEIVIKGQKATSVADRSFLIVNMKIINSGNKGMQLNTRDFIRLGVGEKPSEWLAPDIHNDPVEIQAISTKYTRVGFPVNDKDKIFRLQIGEIEGKKEIVNLSF